MYSFPTSITPAVRSHLDAQAAFFTDVSKSLTQSFQNLCELNMQLGQTLIEESNFAGQQLLATVNPADALSAAAARAQPAADKLRAYQQHISRILADTQVELQRVAGQHIEQTSLTARALADEVARAGKDEAGKAAASFQQHDIVPAQAH